MRAIRIVLPLGARRVEARVALARGDELGHGAAAVVADGVGGLRWWWCCCWGCGAVGDESAGGDVTVLATFQSHFLAQSERGRFVDGEVGGDDDAVVGACAGGGDEAAVDFAGDDGGRAR